MKEIIPTYNGMLQLHDNHTWWKIDNLYLDDVSPVELEEDIGLVIDGLNSMFYDKFKTEAFFLGRSNRHCCVEDNDYNRRHYKSMRNFALKLEKLFIEQFNADGKEE